MNSKNKEITAMDKGFSIEQFAMFASGGAWIPFKHLILVCEMLMYIIQGRLSRLMIFMPPRHGKSELISYYFLTWLFLYFPDTHVILATHSARFSRKWGRRVRNLLKRIGGHSIFPEPITISQDSQAADVWDIENHKGGLVTNGVGGAILGEGANGFIIDDPTKGFKKARSKTHQQELNDWWYTEAKTRLNADIENGRKPWVIGIWQRLNINDLAGQILYKKEGDKRVPNEPQIGFKEAIQILREGGSIPYGTWVILNLPAIALEEDPLSRTPGTPLWPEQKPLKELEQIQKEMGSFRFNAVYQGEPREPEGNVFFRKWFKKMPDHEMDKIIKKLPSLRYWDLGSSGEDGDATAASLTFWDGETFYWRRQLKKKLTPKGVSDYFLNISLRDGKKTAVRIEQEPGASPKILIDKLRRQKELKGYRIRADKVSKAGDKLTRSFDLQALAEDGKVVIAESIFDMVVDDLVEFTGEDGGEDDLVDTGTGAARYWTRSRAKINA